MSLTHRLRTVLAAAAVSASGLGGVAAAASAAPAHPNFSGIWEPMSDSMKPLGRPQFTPFSIDAAKPPPPNSPAAIMLLNGLDETDLNCLAQSQPWTMIQSGPIDFIQDDKELIVLNEYRFSTMRVYLDGRPHPDMATFKRTLMGHSIGRWEGDELVVDTVGFADLPGHGPLNDLPHTASEHVVERFHLEKDGQELHARFTIEDPKLFTRPYEYDFTWYRKPAATTYANVQLCDPRDSANTHY